jgi:enoyl-CoA hydratase/carnithine racemase
LVADLAEQIDKLAGGQLDAILELELNSGDSMNLFNEGLLKTVVNLLDASDMDTQEKVGIY